MPVRGIESLIESTLDRRCVAGPWHHTTPLSGAEPTKKATSYADFAEPFH